MTLKEARQLRDYIHSKCDLHCTVPLGLGPDGYFPRSIFSTGRHDWQSRAEFRAWFARHIRERRRILRKYEQSLRPVRRRSPIEIMIDRACGLA